MHVTEEAYSVIDYITVLICIKIVFYGVNKRESGAWSYELRTSFKCDLTFFKTVCVLCLDLDITN